MTAGKLIQEHSTIVETGNDAKLLYLTQDQLGSPRINTDAVGSVIARHDYHPFGEEISTGQRTSNLGYGGDNVRKKFTGYERDDEIELEYAQARYYSSSHGRFSSADPVMISPQRLANPQMINLYAYAVNNPHKFTDPTGKKVYDLGAAAIKKLQSEIKAKQQEIKNAPEANRAELQRQLGELQNDLAITVAATAVAQAWLKAAQNSGELKNRKVENYKFAPTIQDARDAIVKYNADPKNKDNLISTAIPVDRLTVALVVGSDVLILGSNNNFKNSEIALKANEGDKLTIGGTTTTKGDLNLVGAGWLVHEDVHHGGNRNEVNAYDAQIGFLDKVKGKFSKEDNFINAVNDAIDARNSEATIRTAPTVNRRTKAKP